MKPRLRYMVLRRDGFTCQYCGRSAPEVRLEVDHVVPRSSGGRDRKDNLVTACWDCNQGKSDLRYSVEALAGEDWRETIQDYANAFGWDVVAEALLELRCFPARYRAHGMWQEHDFMSDLCDASIVLAKRRGRLDNA